jgi:hypothetical protein
MVLEMKSSTFHEILISHRGKALSCHAGLKKMGPPYRQAIVRREAFRNAKDLSEMEF